MHASRSITLAILSIALLVSAGCSRERQDWRSAEAADTIESYGEFLGKHPDSELAAKARERVSQLAEERDWQAAGTADTLEAYRRFLAQYPQGRWAEEARIRIESFSMAEPPSGNVAAPGELARVEAAPAAVSEPRATPQPPAAPRPAPAPQPTPAVASAARSDGFGVQLGAFRDEAKARAEWQRLAGRFPRELGALAPHYIHARTSAGPLVRLQAGVADEARARSLCATLKTAGQGCVVVLPVRR